ncbi:MAG: WG repeat-containing protein, partial [Ruminiclostridium sp.]|nr:WG repeat-containing protein [Ruminiclostridium sp.]
MRKKTLFQQGLLAVARLGARGWGYINPEGDFVIEQRFSSADNFDENGLAFVKDIDKPELCNHTFCFFNAV